MGLMLDVEILSLIPAFVTPISNLPHYTKYHLVSALIATVLQRTSAMRYHYTVYCSSDTLTASMAATSSPGEAQPSVTSSGSSAAQRTGKSCSWLLQLMHSWQENESKICTELTFPLTHHAALTSTSREQGEQRVSRATLTLGSPCLWVFNSA